MIFVFVRLTSYQKIEGPTQKVKFPKIASQVNAKKHQATAMTVLSLEVHINTVESLLPDPKVDAITSLFRCDGEA